MGWIAPSDPKGWLPCDLFVHDEPTHCVHMVLIHFRRSLT